MPVVIANAPVSCAEILKRFPELFTDSSGDVNRTIRGVGSPETARPDQAIFLASPKAIGQGLQSAASVIVTGKRARPELEPKLGDRTLLIATNVELAMASVVHAYFLASPYTNRGQTGVHPTAVVSDRAELGKDVRIGPHAFVGAGCKLADGVYVGANAVIEDETEIGEGTVIHPLVFVGHSTRIGRRCEVHPNSTIAKEGFGYAHDEKGNHYRIPHQGRVVIEDDVHIGASCAIDRATFGETRVEAGAKFDNQVHIAHNCRIGRNALLTAGFTIAGSSRIGANFVTGGKTVVTGHIEVGDNVQLAALSAVSKSITAPGQYGGNPLMPLQQFIKVKAAQTHLPEMRKQIKRIMKHLGLGDDDT